MKTTALAFCLALALALIMLAHGTSIPPDPWAGGPPYPPPPPPPCDGTLSDPCYQDAAKRLPPVRHPVPKPPTTTR